MDRLLPLLIVPLIAACVTPLPPGAPEFAQRAAPPEGQNEIELLAGFNGRLAIRDNCLGAVSVYPEADTFVTIIWPSSARLVRDGNSWRVNNTANGESIRVGERISGGGGYAGKHDRETLKLYNRFLTRKLSIACAQFGTFSLNRDFQRQ